MLFGPNKFSRFVFASELRLRCGRIIVLRNASDEVVRLSDIELSTQILENVHEVHICPSRECPSSA